MKHADHHLHMMHNFKKRFFISTILSIPVLILSPIIQAWFRFYLVIPGQRYIVFLLATIIFMYGGKPFLSGLISELKNRRPGMMTLVGIAITIAYMYSVAVLLGLSGKLFFWELVSLIDVMLLGHWIEMRSVLGASRALEKLVELMPAVAHKVMVDQKIIDVAIEDLIFGDTVLVRPGEKIPVDGQVVDGRSYVNQAALTGESKPVAKKIQDKVLGGSVNGNGTLTISVQKMGDKTYIAQVVELVRVASQSKSLLQDRANRAAFWLTIIALGAGAITLAIWLFWQVPLAFAIERMVTVMVVTCPHALGLAVPLVIAMISGISARHGLLIRNKVAFERASDLDIIVFDKTGTLTTGDFTVIEIITNGDWSKEKLLSFAAALEVKATHSLARAIVTSAQEQNAVLPVVSSFELISGKGTQGVVDEEQLYVGGANFLDDIAQIHRWSSKQVSKIKKDMLSYATQGNTVIFVANSTKIQGYFVLGDIVRVSSKKACAQLQQQGVAIAMITGDNQVVADQVASELGIEHYFAHVLPDQKASKIESLQKQGHIVAMVGDGINDAPALMQADVGIAIGAGTDIAIESADIILVHDDPSQVVDIIALSRVSNRKMKQNLFWATAYNVVAIPLAAGLLAPWGIILPPSIGALIMSLSTIIVAFNARLIRYVPLANK